MDLQEELLRTLSFFEPMSLEHIFLDLDKSFLDTYDELTTDDLLFSLKALEKKSRIKEIRKDDQRMWVRIHPKKSIYRKCRDFLKL